MRKLHAAFLVWFLFLACSVSAVAREPQTLHVYHIGNSLTRSITMDRLHLLFAEQGIDYQFSTQLAAGCTLTRHWARAKRECRRANGRPTNLPGTRGSRAVPIGIPIRNVSGPIGKL